MRHKEETVERKRLALQKAIEGYGLKNIKTALGTWATDIEAEAFSEAGAKYRKLRDIVLGTPWHLLGDKLHSLLNTKNRRIINIKDEE